MEYVFYFVITISILVFVHEFGHFIAAKICKMRTDVFAIGFGKRLFGWNLKKGFTFGALPKDYDGEGTTDYRISLLPLGGYVKIAGMVDESFDTDFAGKTPEPYEFRAKPTIQKLFVISAGVIMNLLLTIFIFWGVIFFNGVVKPSTTSIAHIENSEFTKKAGFQNKDKILTINGVKVNDYEDIIMNLGKNASKPIEAVVMRNGQEVKLNFSGDLVADAAVKGVLVYPWIMPLASEVLSNSPAEEGGMKKGDLIVSLNNQEVERSEDAIKIIEANKEKTIRFVVLRGDNTVELKITPSSSGKIGVSMGQGPIAFYKFGLLESLGQGFVKIKDMTVTTLTAIKEVITGKSDFKKSFGGPIQIAQFAKSAADSGGFAFFDFLALLSLSLAILNILPFPVLDGGHFVIILLEGIFRKEIPIKIKIAIQNVGFVLILILMAFILYSDILKL
jgi:regulator of sigma E protease